MRMRSCNVIMCYKISVSNAKTSNSILNFTQIHWDFCEKTSADVLTDRTIVALK